MICSNNFENAIFVAFEKKMMINSITILKKAAQNFKKKIFFLTGIAMSKLKAEIFDLNWLFDVETSFIYVTIFGNLKKIMRMNRCFLLDI